MKYITVSTALQLDADAIQAAMTFERWVKALEIVTDAPTWDTVYEELAAVIIGARRYKKYSQTAIRDLEMFEKFAVVTDAKTTRQTTRRRPTKQASKALVKVGAKA